MKRRTPWRTEVVKGNASKTFCFDNGYSVRALYGVRDRVSGPIIAFILGPHGRRTYDTPLNDDIVEQLNQAGLDALLQQVESWPRGRS